MKAPVRKVRCAVYTRVSTDERLDMEFNSLDAQREAALVLHRQPEARGLDPRRRPLRRRRLLRRQHGSPGAAAAAARCRERRHRRDRRLQGRSAQPLAHRLRKNCRSIRKEQSLVRQHNPAVQHDDVDGPADAQHPAQLRPVRARGDRRAHPRQVRRVAPQGHVDGRHPAARLRRRRPQAGGERDGGRARPAHLQAVPARRLGDEAGAGAAPRRPHHEILDDAGRQAPAGQADRQGRDLQDPRTTASTSARRCTRGRAIPASTRRSSIARPGTRSTPSSPRTRSLAPTALARRRRRCCAA